MEGLTLDGTQLARGSPLVTLLDPRIALKKISSVNLIVEFCEFNFAVCRRSVLSFLAVLKFNYFLFERNSGKVLEPYYYIGSGEVVGLSGDPVQVIELAAKRLAGVLLSKEGDPTVEISIDKVNVYEVREFRYSQPDPFLTSYSQRKPF